MDFILLEPEPHVVSLPSWSFLDGWSPPRTQLPAWGLLEPWLASLARIAADERKALAPLRAKWDHDLEELGGDPSAFDWSSFAPLRRDREEDWSDWLAQLITDSANGGLAWHLFGAFEQRDRTAYCRPTRVHREHPMEGRRADLIVEWQDRWYTHVEVKVGDPHLEKTLETSEKVGRAMAAHCRGGSDFLLILDTQEAAWTNLVKEDRDLKWNRVRRITWRDVAVALRRTLLDPAPAREHVRWRVWAHALCGAIEQELLGLPGHPDAERWRRALNVSSILIAVELLRDGQLPDEVPHV